MKFVYYTPPENFKAQFSVVGCFIRIGEEFLFLKQHPLDSEANMWGIPGGKVNKGENTDEAAIREVREETGLHITAPLDFCGKVYIRYPEIDFEYSMYEASFDMKPEISIDSNEHIDFRWMTLSEALTLPLIRGEDECIRLVYSDIPVATRKLSVIDGSEKKSAAQSFAKTAAKPAPA